METTLIGGIDAGGTTFKCGIATLDGQILSSHRVPTSTPEQTLAACMDFFRGQCAARETTLAVLGLACFGPLNVDPESPDYGVILNSPKTLWRGVRIRETFSAALSIDVVVDTDVNAALLAEQKWGAAQHATTPAYVTAGTGIGGAVLANGQLVGRPRHPELGHIPVRRHRAHVQFEGVCPMHGDCLEGLASVPAFTKSFGDPLTLPLDHEGWDAEAWYLGQLCLTLSLAFRNDRIILGGGLMQAPHLLDRIRRAYAILQRGFLEETEADIERMIVSAALGDDAGLMGGVALGMSALSRSGMR